MNLDYNIFFELAVIPLDIMICIFLELRYSRRSKINKAYRRFAYFVAIATITDVLTAVVTSARAQIPNPIHYFFNTADSMLAAATGVTFFMYMYAYVKGESQIRYISVYILLVVDYIVLLTNPFTHLVFYYDENGNYIHQVLFVPVAYVAPILFFVIGCGFMLTHWRAYKKSQIYVMIIAMVITGAVFLLQMLFFDNYLITFFMASLGSFVIYMSLETPDYEKLLETMEQLQESREKEAVALAQAKLSKEVMLALSQAVDAKDHYTNGHSLRVAEYSRLIAERMGKDEKAQEDIYCVGLLHDIGKIGVHEDILNKKGKLTAEEFNEIKSHTVTGYEILKSITGIPGLSTGARWHHEKYDGSGYPDGLKGEDIPELARIICLADCYDAMTSRRSYSNPKPQNEVRAEIIRCKGAHFDPDIADVMVAIIDDDKDFTLREKV